VRLQAKELFKQTSFILFIFLFSSASPSSSSSSSCYFLLCLCVCVRVSCLLINPRIKKEKYSVSVTTTGSTVSSSGCTNTTTKSLVTPSQHNAFFGSRTHTHTHTTLIYILFQSQVFKTPLISYATFIQGSDQFSVCSHPWILGGMMEWIITTGKLRHLRWHAAAGVYMSLVALCIDPFLGSEARPVHTAQCQSVHNNLTILEAIG
jgi:hypothetical protein